MNNDRFKFRAWNIENKEYVCDYDSFIIGDMCKDHGKTIIIEQCTGERDSNGTLIYEGDIVSFLSSPETGTIVFKHSGFIWEWKYGRPLIADAISGNPQLSGLNQCYIIGNIHDKEQE